MTENIFKNVSSALALCVVIAATLGCGMTDKLRTAANSSGDNRPVTTSDPTGTKTSGGARMFESSEQIDAFVSKLKETVGSDDPKLLDLLIYDQYIMVKVQDPKNPENIDGYTYRDGKLSAPAPVKIIGNGKIEENVFPLSTVNLSALPSLTAEIGEKLKTVEGGRMTGYSIKRGLPFKKDVYILVLADGTRKSVSAEADAKGKLTRFEVK